MTEIISVLAMFLGGCALARVTGLRGWPLPAVGLLTGVALLVAIGMGQVVLPFVPTTPVVTLALTVGLPVTWWLWRLRRGGDVTVSLPLALASVASVAGAVVLIRAAKIVTFHSDSFGYLMAARLLADDTYSIGVSTYMVTNRAPGMPLIHAPASVGGDYYLQSVTPLLALATLGALAWFIRVGAPRDIGRATMYGLIAFALLALVTNNRFVFNAFYLNGHLLQGALVLLVVGAGWLLVTRPARESSALMMLQLVAIPGLIVIRAEGLLVTVLALLPTWLSTLPARHRAATMAVTGAYGSAWYGFQIWVYADRGAGVPASLAGPLALAVVILALAGLTAAGRLRLGQRANLWGLWLAESGLWLALVAFAIMNPDNLGYGINSIGRNLVDGRGRWGLSLVILGLFVMAAVLFIRMPHRHMLRFPLTTFLPLALLLGYIREVPYRPGATDSLNRMWMHTVPLAVLFVVISAAEALRPRGPASAPMPPEAPARPVGTGDRP
jgi:hypothetical protein